MIRNIHRVGAVFYVAWGFLHIVGGAALMLMVATGDPAGALAALESARVAGTVPGDPGSIVAGVVAFHGWNILWSGALVAAVAARWTWRNTSLGAWLPFVVVAVADLGLLLFLLVPGEMSWADGIWGPLLFVPAAATTAIGRRRSKRPGLKRPGDERLLGYMKA